ncbi:thioredoxin-like [Macrosteles quadrilineatus]|uniref:thioredoxin-like n=1 Tax=Macrosteles quadrilineatus TaxID=74068 RepID=UPI0023E2A941|nr:thioredoxin-like [Macrosteles quadrilineatus]
MPNFQEMSGMAQTKAKKVKNNDEKAEVKKNDEKAEAKKNNEKAEVKKNTEKAEANSLSKAKTTTETNNDVKSVEKTSSSKLKREDSKKENKVREVKDEDDFEARLKTVGEVLTVVDFYATWCNPCRMVSQRFNSMAEEFKDVKFLKVNIEENETLAAKYDVKTLPTFVFIKQGKVVETIVGSNMSRVEDTVKKLRGE